MEKMDPDYSKLGISNLASPKQFVFGEAH